MKNPPACGISSSKSKNSHDFGSGAKITEGLILLHDTQEHTIEEDGKVIRVMPVWKWLLK
jgi:predicted AAA+ superfamily ATPase